MLPLQVSTCVSTVAPKGTSPGQGLSLAQVLCASNAAHDQVDPIVPPEGVPLGERITFEGFGNEPDAQLNPKKNIFGKLAPALLTDAGKQPYQQSSDGIACFHLSLRMPLLLVCLGVS